MTRWALAVLIFYAAAVAALATCGNDTPLKYPITLAAAVAKEYEGLQLAPYHDPAGYPTVGYGHKLSSIPHESLSRYKPITETVARALLHQDLRKAQESVRRLVKVRLTAGQEAALIDFVFNLGAEALEGSELLADVNAGRIEAVPGQLRRWIHADGEVEEGLVRRRAAEAALWVGVNRPR